LKGNLLIIDVWSAAASSGQPGHLEQCCENWLTAEELQRADRFRVSTSRNQHVVGRGMTRKLLASFAASAPNDINRSSAIEPSQIVFAFTPYGKPYVVAPEPVMRPFNVAHTDSMVLFTHTPSGCIGVDVERISRKTDVALAERYFAKPEVQYVLDHIDPEKQLQAFLRVWTLKESFIKAIGTGLSMPLADFAFADIDDLRPKVRMLNPTLGSGDRWQFITFAPADGYVGAVAFRADDPTSEPDLQLLRFESLIDI